ncbi:4'-phosphopantetheinyl transferase family protein [Streptomyces sp. NPDC091027]|uniref:4'-phosphopantetheinyl transferase family protein n=1 Tax=Streptomyces sp. NPDC091027 TaxID=3365971 RepID=UPI00381BA091
MSRRATSSVNGPAPPGPRAAAPAPGALRTPPEAPAAPGAACPGFLPAAPGALHRWGRAGLLVARHRDVRRAPPLSPAERCAAASLPAPRRAAWPAVLFLARILVADALGVPAAEVEVLTGEDGGPYALVGGGPAPGVHLSLGRAGGHLAAAIAPGPVGVDLRETSAGAAERRRAGHALSARERALAGADRPEALAAVRALKEAAAKADRGAAPDAAPRPAAVLGLCPPVLTGRRSARVWRTGDAVVALVLAGPPDP